MCRQDAEESGTGIDGPGVDLCRAEPQSEPVGALPENHWGEAGNASGHWRGAWIGNGSGDTSSVEGGGSLCAAGSVVSGAALAIHFAGQRSGGVAGAECFAGLAGRN